MSVAYNQSGVAYNATAVAYNASAISGTLTTIAGQVRAAIIAAVSTAHVASTAGVDLTTWTNYRVFDGLAAPFGARNRGRLPFVEIQIDSEPFTPEGEMIGGVETRATIRVNLAGVNRTNAQALGEGILHAIFAAMRADSPFFAIGSTSMDAFESKAGWHTLTGSVKVEHTYDPNTFEVSP